MAKKVVQNSDFRSMFEVMVDLQVFNREPDWEFNLIGKLPSKKNNYQPNGKSFFKPQKIKDAEKTIWYQIPDELRDAKLRHPHIIVECQIPKKSWRSDRDNGYTFLQDVLVQAGVLADDSINHFNGYVMMVPVVECDEYRTKVRIWKNE